MNTLDNTPVIGDRIGVECMQTNHPHEVTARIVSVSADQKTAVVRCPVDGHGEFEVTL